MAATTPTGQQPADDALALAYHANSWRPWEQGGTTTTAGFVAQANDPAGHYTWRVSRSTDNKGRPG